ncbi:CBS domain-containing protein [Rhodospirillales bacterium URHD0017]|nr:CBS domain-containing protein [Rhodospirillales bacterium URHD0017]
MSKPAISASEDTRLKDIADLMVKHRIHNVPVVRGARVEGMVNRVALVKALLSRPAADGATAPPAAATEVDDEQLRRDVVVARRGSIHLWGNAFNEEDHRNYRAAATRVPGVRDVHSHMQVRPPRAAGLLR